MSTRVAHVRSLRAGRLAALAASACLIAWPVAAQEHPEHPKKKSKQEHPEHPKDKAKQEHPEHPKEHPEHPAKPQPVTFTVDDMAHAIEAYVKKDSALKGGRFLVFDPAAGKPLALQLEKVHRERLSQIGEGVVFVCADFRSDTGQVHDLDIFMKGPDKDHLVVTEISIHKDDGKPRYTWHEHDGVWVKHAIAR